MNKFEWDDHGNVTVNRPMGEAFGGFRTKIAIVMVGDFDDEPNLQVTQQIYDDDGDLIHQATVVLSSTETRAAMGRLEAAHERIVKLRREQPDLSPVWICLAAGDKAAAVALYHQIRECTEKEASVAVALDLKYSELTEPPSEGQPSPYSEG